MRTPEENIRLLLKAAKYVKQGLEQQQEKWRAAHHDVGLNRTWLDIRWRAIAESLCYVNGKIAGYELALTCFRPTRVTRACEPRNQ